MLNFQDVASYSYPTAVFVRNCRKRAAGVSGEGTGVKTASQGVGFAIWRGLSKNWGSTP